MTFEEILHQHPDLSTWFAEHEPVRSAASVAGLLTAPALHPYNLRIETLIHLLLVFAKGAQHPCNEDLDRWLDELGKGICGHMEDPPEGVFVSNICTRGGNRRIFEGIWDSASSYLQRFVDVLENMPEGDLYNYIRESSLALLSLSEAVAVRADISRFTAFDDDPRDGTKTAAFGSCSELRGLIEFSHEELLTLGITPQQLEPFLFPPEQIYELRSQSEGESQLERRPVLLQGNKIWLLLPTAVSVAIRLFAIESLRNAGLLGQLHQALTLSYRDHLKETPILGEMTNAPLRFEKFNGLGVALTGKEIDRGKWISLIVFVDDFTGFTGNLVTRNSDPDIENSLALCLRECQQQTAKHHNVEDGIHFVISCGWGCATAARLPPPSPGWRIVHASAADVATLSWTPSMEILDLWRLLDAEDQLQADGVQMVNASGLLNLYAWWKRTDFSLLPGVDANSDSRLPDLLLIPTDCLLELRKKVLLGFDERMARDIDGSFVRVRRKTAFPFFQQLDEERLSVSLRDISTNLRGVIESNKGRAWWCEFEFEGASRYELYQHWEAVCSWLSRAVDKLEEHFFPRLPEGSILWRTTLEPQDKQRRSPRMSHDAVAKKMLSVTAHKSPSVVQVNAKSGFYSLWNDPTNVAERSLVRELVRGVSLLAEAEWNDDQVDTLTNEIVPNADARYTHGFSVPRYSDYFQEQLRSNTKVVRADEVFVGHALAWKAGVDRTTRSVVSKEGCLTLLHKAVLAQWVEIQEVLKRLDRPDIITRLLTNHEALESDQLRWQRTMRALLGLYGTQNRVIETATDYIASISASTLACRLLIEMAVCECPEVGGLKAGKLELSRLLANAITIFHLGGWSDAIHDEILDAELSITPVGQILPKSDLADSVMRPLGVTLQSAILSREAARYEKHYQADVPLPSADKVFEAEFLDAFEIEYGVSLDDLLTTVEFLERAGIEQQRPVYSIKQSQLYALVIDGKPVLPKAVTAILRCFVTRSRSSWAVPPAGFDNNDIKPWRFRRRLSVISRPIIRLDESDDPSYLVAPALFRQSLLYNLTNAHEAKLSEKHFKSLKMRRWVGSQRNRLGHAFNLKVSQRLIELGWQAKANKKLSEILNRKMPDIGDVDVLSWSSRSHRVFAIECKDLGFAKTHAEVGTYLKRFRGEVDDKGRPDELLRHLNRCKKLQEFADYLAKYVGATRSVEVIPLLVFSQPSPVIYRVPIGLTRDDIFTFDELHELVAREGA